VALGVFQYEAGEYVKLRSIPYVRFAPLILTSVENHISFGDHILIPRDFVEAVLIFRRIRMHAIDDHSLIADEDASLRLEPFLECPASTAPRPSTQKVLLAPLPSTEVCSRRIDLLFSQLLIRTFRCARRTLGGP
jgi:hypothetical protein